jgi:serine/threonine protein kinase
MDITIGQRLGSYEVTALLGKVGMGEVYRACDVKLKREVAIKILPEEFSRDSVRMIRFQREAEVLESSQHRARLRRRRVLLPMEQRTDSCNHSFQRHYVGPRSAARTALDHCQKGYH